MIADTVLMIRPVNFGFNVQSAETNSFQKKVEMFSALQIQDIARLEFDHFVELLQSKNIEVMVFDDLKDPYTPDSIFPNNWISTCPHSKRVYTYPMCNEIRANERRRDVIQSISEKSNYTLDESLIDFEAKSLYLEGTGSLVLDHENKIAYAAISPRTTQKVLEEWSLKTDYDVVAFKAYGPEGELIYHTNVMMCIADKYVVICLDSIKDESERNKVRQCLIEQSRKDIIEISLEQTHQHFTGNMLQLCNKNGEKFLVMSKSAERSLSPEQLDEIQKKHGNEIIAPSIHMIETIGGGSARCMIAEVFRN